VSGGLADFGVAVASCVGCAPWSVKMLLLLLLMSRCVFFLLPFESGRALEGVLWRVERAKERYVAGRITARFASAGAARRRNILGGGRGGLWGGFGNGEMGDDLTFVRASGDVAAGRIEAGRAGAAAVH
jgi:hypothetical protein